MKAFPCAALFVAALIYPDRAPAQAKIAGQWSVRYTRVYRNLHSGDTSIVENTALMTLQPRGDSVFGFWQDPHSPGEPPPVYRSIRGTYRGDSVRVQVELPPNDDDGFFASLGRDIVEFLKTHIHNMPTTIPLYEFTVRKDSLVGTRRSMTLDGATVSAPRPFDGVRAGKSD